MKRLILIGLLLSTVLPVYAMGPMPVSVLSDPLTGKPAPEFTLPRMNGEASNFTSAREGKKAVIIFWATWCPHCHEELAQLSTRMPDYEAKGIKILLVNVGETREEVKAYFERKGYMFNSFLDEENALQDPYHLIGVPTVVFVNESGVVTRSLHEFPKEYEEYFQLK